MNLLDTNLGLKTPTLFVVPKSAHVVGPRNKLDPKERAQAEAGEGGSRGAAAVRC